MSNLSKRFEKFDVDEGFKEILDILGIKRGGFGWWEDFEGEAVGHEVYQAELLYKKQLAQAKQSLHQLEAWVEGIIGEDMVCDKCAYDKNGHDIAIDAQNSLKRSQRRRLYADTRPSKEADE